MKKKAHTGLAALTLAGLLLCQHSPVLGAANTSNDSPGFDLDQVVITATRLPEKVKDVPASVTVITSKDLENMNVKTLDDALQFVPGVYIKPQRGMKATKISIRGLSQNRVLVLSDGMPLNNGYTGGASWPNIPIENIERIEVIRGPVSALYGSSAMGGVINIITKEHAAPQTSVTLGTGQMGTKTLDVNHNASVGKLEYYVNFSKNDSDGYITNPAAASDGQFGTNLEQYSLKVIYNFDNKNKLIVSRGESDYKYSYATSANRAERKTETTNIQYKGQISPDKDLTVRWSELNFSDYWTITGSNYSPNPAVTREGEVNLNWRLNDQHTLTLGASTKIDTCDGQTYKLSNPAIISYKNLLEQSGGKTQTNSVYFQDEIKWTPKTTVILSGRYDKWKFYNGYNAAGAMAEKNASNFSPKASILFKPNDRFSWYLSAGKAFVTPTIFNLARRWETTGVLLLPNPDLQPEKSTSYELGANYQIDQATTAKVAFFRNNVENMIYQGFNRYLTRTKQELQWRNAGEAEITGLELELQHRFSPQWFGFINYTHNNPTITANSDPSLVGKQIPTVPKDTFNFGFTYEKEKFTANLLGRYISRAYESDDNSEALSGYGSFQPHFVVDTKFIYRFDQKSSIALSINNLFDREYYQESMAPGRNALLEFTQKF